jgi:divinyl chlorophyllide a 8-vinyl-reductase
MSAAKSAPKLHKSIFVAGATGTIGRAVVGVLVEQGFHVVCYLRMPAVIPGVEVRLGEMADVAALGFRGERFDAVISCMASRSGVPDDAWAVDHDAHVALLAAARDAGVPQFILLSAICVQKPKLAFQFAKLAFEEKLIASGLRYSIVRPTAYFKSLAGQIRRLQAGKPFLLFGNGALTACKPISDRDLANYLVSCLDDASKHNRILPIGGPGPALTPREQGAVLFRLLGKPAKFRTVPVAMMDVIIRGLTIFGAVSPRLEAKAELAKIGRYYATESMLVWDAAAGRYDAGQTPETGSERLEDFYCRLISGEEKLERGAHAVF